MTTITVPRAVLEQALEALEATHYDVGSAEKQRLEAVDAITALRAALAQPDMHPQCAQGCEFLAMEQRRNERKEGLKERGFE
jgi:hypothetical protein